MSDFLPFIVIGITTGAVYGLAGVGLALTYKTSGIFNFAYGAVAALPVQHSEGTRRRPAAQSGGPAPWIRITGPVGGTKARPDRTPPLAGILPAVDVDEAKAHGFDPTDYVSPTNVGALLGRGWHAVLDERRPRDVTAGASAHHKHDVVSLARRLG